MPKKFVRTTSLHPANIKHYIQGKQCDCRHAFHRCRDTGIVATLQGCKCQTGRLMQQVIADCGCEEAFVYGELARDPGFEGQLALTGSTDIPIDADYMGEYFGQGVYKYNGPTPGAYTSGPTDTYVAQGEVDLSNGDYVWEVSTIEPDTGTYHLKTTTMYGGGRSGSNIMLQTLPKCDFVAESPPYHAPTFAGKCVAGDLITVSCRAKMTTGTSGTGNVSMHFGIYWLDIDGKYQGTGFNTGSSTANLTLSYATYSDSFVAPTGAFYVAVSFGNNSLGGAAAAGHTRDVYLDNISAVLS